MTTKVALFGVQGEAFALDIEKIVQILEVQRIFPLPLLPEGFSGVLLYRNVVVPWLDPGPPLGMSGPGGSAAYAVIYAAELGLVALGADRLGGVVAAARGRFEPVEENDGPFFKRLFVFAEKRYPLLDVDKRIASLSAENFPAPPSMGARRIE